MYNCFHTTKKNNLTNIAQNGLKPFYGANSFLTAERRNGIVSYSTGVQATVDTFSVFERFYYYVKEGWVDEDSFKENLSPEDYAKHQQSVNTILETESFEDWTKDNIYLCFDGNYLSDRNEEEPENSYTTQSIPPEQLKVCIIRNKKDDSIIRYSMTDIYCCLYAKNPELEKCLGTYRFQEGIDKYKSDDYYMEYLSIEEFLKLDQTIVNEKTE